MYLGGVLFIPGGFRFWKAFFKKNIKHPSPREINWDTFEIWVLPHSGSQNRCLTVVLLPESKDCDFKGLNRYYSEALNDVFSKLLKTYLILSAVVGSLWKRNRTLCKCIAAPGAWETNLNHLEIIILLCHKVNANRNKAFCITVINHCQMGDVVWSIYLVWTFADVTDSSNNINERKTCRVLVYADLPSIHQNSSPKPVRRNKENAYFNYNIEKT